MTTTSNISNIVTLPVTPQGVEINNINHLHSEQGRKAVFQALCFGGVQSLLIKTSSYQKLLTLVDAMKAQGRTFEATKLESSDRYLQIKDAAELSATRLAVTHALAEASFPIELDFTAQIQRGSSADQIAKKAQFAGVDADLVKQIEQKNIIKKYQEAEHAQDLAAALFYGADVIDRVQVVKDEYGYETGENEVMHSVYLRPEMILKAFTRARDYLLSWNTPDWTELGLLKADIETLEKAAEKYEELTERANESARHMDEMTISAADMVAGGSK